MDIIKVGQLIHTASKNLQDSCVLPYFIDDSLFYNYKNTYGKVEEFIYVLYNKSQETCFLLYCSDYKNDIVLVRYKEYDKMYNYIKICNISKREEDVVNFCVGVLLSNESSFNALINSIETSDLLHHIYTDKGFFVDTDSTAIDAYPEPGKTCLEKTGVLSTWDIYGYKRNVGVILKDFFIETDKKMLDNFYAFRAYKIILDSGINFALDSFNKGIRR